MNNEFTIEEIMSIENSYLDLCLDDNNIIKLFCLHPIYGMGLQTLFVFEILPNNNFKIIRRETPVPIGETRNIKYIITNYDR